MDKILVFDLVFLVLFSIILVIFLSKNKKNLKREGLMYLYRTQLGVRAIENFSKNKKNLLRKLKYPIIIIGFILMGLIISLLGLNAYTYITQPKLVNEMTGGAPPIAPLIPYFPKIFGMERFFPEFYFSYFIIALAIVAVVHEFSHGVFMRLFKVKIKSTGFIFLGPILGAFVEQDDKDLLKKKNSEQMTILGAGVFANILFALIFFILLILFFNLSYSPAGYNFSGYALGVVNSSEIKSFENYSTDLILARTSNSSYFISSEAYGSLQNEEIAEGSLLLAYLDSPAIRNKITGAIISVDQKKISSFEEFYTEVATKKPGENITLVTKVEKEVKEYNFILGENPQNNSKGFIGITNYLPNTGKGIVGKVSSYLIFKDPLTYYESNYNTEVADFIYYLFWWIALINLFVAMFNMLPLGILDGGRFCYLFILSLTKSKKKTEKIYKLILSTITLIFILILAGWVFSKFLQ